MMKRELYSGKTLLQSVEQKVAGELVEIKGEPFYKISNYDRMPAFFMSIVSNSDHWMFISSRGGLTCGRKNPENALFPYYTDDKIHDSATNSGPKTIIIATIAKRSYVWQPFECVLSHMYKIERNLYKSIYGNQLIFEEKNHDLELTFSHSWMNSDKYGFVRESVLKNLSSSENIEIDVLDGLRNILPYGVNRGLQTNMSTLVDGYKQAELIENSGLALFTLSSILTDRAEPSESLKATTVWQIGLEDPKFMLSEDQLTSFTQGNTVDTENFKKGIRGAFFVSNRVIFKPDETKNWFLVADLNQGPSEVALLTKVIQGSNIREDLKIDIANGTQELKKLVHLADGAQLTNDRLISDRHFSNVLFNCMRGGIFLNEYRVDSADFADFLSKWNKQAAEKYADWLKSQGTATLYFELTEKIRELNDPELYRLALEYLPLTFSRRHGDPSRPWNLFSIDIKKPDGSANLYYQGNWRDIFQNWEALSLSFPEFIESFVVKFVNASTADGYNPYRITRDGIDWEILDPEDPWSNIGYWGDHQLIYLLRLLEISHHYHPGKIEEFLKSNLFVYAHVPYELKPYSEIVKNPRSSILYNTQTADAIAARVAKTGSDGKLQINAHGEIHKVNLTEKILVSLLAKFINFVPEGGIWMNTQRPEWNDANNALVGYGLSMVTLYQMRRFLSLTSQLLEGISGQSIECSNEVISLLNEIIGIQQKYQHLLTTHIFDKDRKTIVDDLGKAGENYRKQIYTGFKGQQQRLEVATIQLFCNNALGFLDQTIAANKRPDGLYHSYNLIQFGTTGFEIKHLYEMLEGQVAVLSSGYLQPAGSLKVLDALRKSAMYRADQRSYMLYPDRKLPLFGEKNNIPEPEISKHPFLVSELLNNSKAIVEKDIDGKIHFNGKFRNAAELKAELDSIGSLNEDEKTAICHLFSELFNHQSFTGRSGTFYKYEGLGSIYWHMVSKLHLACGEILREAIEKKSGEQVIQNLKKHFGEIKEGLGAHKTPEEYGAFPIDPYSHTPGFAGVQQPGMTGQVKEDIITRFAELGVKISNGEISFDPAFLNPSEFIKKPVKWQFYKSNNQELVEFEENCLAFCICGIPVIYKHRAEKNIEIHLKDGSVKTFQGNTIDKIFSNKIFKRDPALLKIEVSTGI